MSSIDIGREIARTAHQATLDQPLTKASQCYGFRYGGPILSTFLHGVAERCKDLNIQKVYFVAREGYLLKKLFDVIAPNAIGKQDLPESHYFFISRKTAILSGLSNYGEFELACCELNGPRTIKNLFSLLEISEDALTMAAKKYGLEINAILPEDYASTKSFEILLSDPLIQKAEHKIRENLIPNFLEYLAQSSFFDDPKVAIVDVGWGANIQAGLTRAISSLPNCPEVYGFYLGTNEIAERNIERGNQIEAILTSQRSPDWLGQPTFQCPVLIEILCRAPHGTVLGYKKSKDHLIEPLLRPENEQGRQLEARDDPVIHDIQAGVLRYANVYSNEIKRLQSKSKDTSRYAMHALERMLRYPTRDEALLVLGLSNNSDLGSDQHAKMGGINSATTPWKFASFINGLRQSLWPHGYIAASSLRPLLWLWVIIRDRPNFRHLKQPKNQNTNDLSMNRRAQNNRAESNGTLSPPIKNTEFSKRFLDQLDNQFEHHHDGNLIDKPRHTAKTTPLQLREMLISRIMSTICS